MNNGVSITRSPTFNYPSYPTGPINRRPTTLREYSPSPRLKRDSSYGTPSTPTQRRATPVRIPTPGTPLSPNRSFSRRNVRRESPKVNGGRAIEGTTHARPLSSYRNAEGSNIISRTNPFAISNPRTQLHKPSASPDYSSGNRYISGPSTSQHYSSRPLTSANAYSSHQYVSRASVSPHHSSNQYASRPTVSSHFSSRPSSYQPTNHTRYFPPALSSNPHTFSSQRTETSLSQHLLQSGSTFLGSYKPVIRESSNSNLRHQFADSTLRRETRGVSLSQTPRLI